MGDPKLVERIEDGALPDGQDELLLSTEKTQHHENSPDDSNPDLDSRSDISSEGSSNSTSSNPSPPNPTLGTASSISATVISSTNTSIRTQPKKIVGYNPDSLDPAVIMQHVVKFFRIPESKLKKFKLVPRAALAPTLKEVATVGAKFDSLEKTSLFSEHDDKIFIARCKKGKEQESRNDIITDFVNPSTPIIIGNTKISSDDALSTQRSSVEKLVHEHQQTYGHFFNSYPQYLGGFLDHVLSNAGGDVTQTARMKTIPVHKFHASQAMMLFGEFDKADGTKEAYCVAIEHRLGFKIQRVEEATEYPIYLPENPVIKIYRANEDGVYLDGIYAIDTQQVEDILANELEPQAGIDDARRVQLNQFLDLTLRSDQVVNYTVLRRLGYAVDAWLQEDDFKESVFTDKIKNNLQDSSELKVEHCAEELIENPESDYRNKRYAVTKTAYTYKGQSIGEVAALYEHVEGKGYYLAGTYATGPMIKELLLHDNNKDKNKVTITPEHFALAQMQQHLKNALEHLEKIMPVSVRKSKIMPLSIISTREMQPILAARAILDKTKVVVNDIQLFTPQVAAGSTQTSDSTALMTLKSHSQLKAILMSLALIVLGLAALTAAIYLTVQSAGTGSFFGYKLAELGTELIVMGSVGVFVAYLASMGTAVGGGVLLKTAYDNSIHKNKAIAELEQVQTISPRVISSLST